MQTGPVCSPKMYDIILSDIWIDVMLILGDIYYIWKKKKNQNPRLKWLELDWWVWV